MLALMVWLWTTNFALSQAESDSLPRRGYFGVSLEPGETGPRVTAVTPGSTAASIGVTVGDVIREIDGKAIRIPEEVVATIGGRKGGEEITLNLLRKTGPESLRVTLRSYPLEEMANATVHYGSVIPFDGVRLRTILSVPAQVHNRPFPAVLLIQGGSCGSVDMPFAASFGQTGLLHAIGSQGFVTMRVEKSGVGDSSGPPCDSIGFHEELAGYQSALRALRSHPDVDSDRVFLIGISLGGVFAPFLVNDFTPAGITVYGTLDGPPSPYPGRSARFFKEIAEIDVTGAWMRTGTRVLVLRGEYDELATTSAHQNIASIVNQSGVGSAEYRELKGLDHCWSRHDSFEASRNNCGRGEMTTDLSETILRFLRSK
jgi:dienelactone hydrolase